PHTETLAWRDNEIASSSGDGSTEVEVRLEFGESARFVDRSPKPSEDNGQEGGPDIAYEYSCNDRLELDATLTLKTADGALDESVPVVVWAESERVVHTNFSLDADEIAGSLEVMVEPPPGFEADGPPELQFNIDIADVGFVGSISVMGTYSGNGGVAAGGGGPIAKWPENNPCDIGFAVATEDSESVQQALAAFNGRGPLTLEYEPEAPASQLSYSLSADSDTVCEELDGGSAGELAFDGELELTSADGSIEANVPVQVTTGLDGGELYFVSVSMVESSESSGEPDQMLESLGIQQAVDFSGYDYGQVWLSAQVYGGALEGSLSVRGAEVPDCLTNPPEPDPNGMGSPGCQGTDFTDLWVASFGE
ncbi:MAG TPA: hypothetical protein VNN80_25985, partial [Polyangiaceae bacterium]|nr:hypothetical protein [Polyangiaceae bacterium]